MTLKTQGLQTLEHIRAFLEGTQPLGLQAPAREVTYEWIVAELRRLKYLRLGKADKGLVRRYINLVDEVCQFQFIGSVERISEHFLLPVLEALIEAFPFVIVGFHADNGSEYINKRVAELLEKLRVQEFTKSRARRTDDSALLESKNGSVVRKHLGYAHIPGRFATQVNAFTQGILSPYLNFHRPCFFPTEEVDAKDRVVKRYRYQGVMTPYDKLKPLPNADHYLKPGITFK
ncbi:integrase catalytic domain-containing protein [Alkalilimnicola ehrlichii]|uniref:integrase catalytic domain-containing protein n=1 Tax=Alkalilimnicola ehrlichii TaxID=351052 RepID=UPI003B9E1424